MRKEYRQITYVLADDVAFLRLNRPSVLNATTMNMGVEMLDAVDRASAEARTLIIGAVGRAFCSGADIANETVFDVNDPDRDAGAALERVFNPLLLRLRDLPIPLVTAVRGAAAGIGCSLALIGDIIVVGRGAFFLQSFRHVGLVPDGGSAYLLAHAIGRVRAMELMLLGERLPAQRAFDLGLVTRVTADEEVDDTAFELGRRLAHGPTRALQLIRRSAWAALTSTFDEQLLRERELQCAAGRTDDFLEGIQAFQQNREAHFLGR